MISVIEFIDILDQYNRNSVKETIIRSLVSKLFENCLKRKSEESVNLRNPAQHEKISVTLGIQTKDIFRDDYHFY